MVVLNLNTYDTYNVQIVILAKQFMKVVPVWAKKFMKIVLVWAKQFIKVV